MNPILRPPHGVHQRVKIVYPASAHHDAHNNLLKMNLSAGS